jgi:aconitate hydratase
VHLSQQQTLSAGSGALEAKGASPATVRPNDHAIMGAEVAPAAWRTLDSGDDRARYASVADAIAQAGGDAAALPYCLRVLVENIARHRPDTGAEGNAALCTLARWPRELDTALPLYPERVILPDSSGLPVLLDLAALRDAIARRGGDPAWVKPRVPVDFVIDHSLQVDHAGSAQAIGLNLAREFERNDERYRFVKWAQAAFGNLRVFPPGTGIIHQVNLEFIADVVTRRQTDDGPVLFPDFVFGGDSHTPMVNGLGVLGWGVGGLDAEAVLLGYPNYIPLPEVVGVRLTGALPAGGTTTDLVLLVTQRLRAHGVTGRFVEFFGAAATALPVPERATLANMAPEYGATVGFFPVDDNTLDYLRATGREAAHVARVAAYCRANMMFRDEHAPAPVYSEVVDIDLRDAAPALAGPRRPQDRQLLADVAPDFRARLARSTRDDGYGVADASLRADEHRNGLRHGSIVVAALTSCTNTSNPAVMIAAGLLARNAVARGLHPPPWVKTSLAPGSQVVTRYLEAAGLAAPLAALGFDVVGYGCTTCGGKSGPLAPDIAAAIERDGLVVATMLSGNRNFDGRIHRLARANYLGSPPLVVAYALAGRVDIDLTREPLGHDRDGKPVLLADLWPQSGEVVRHLGAAADPALYRAVYGDAERGTDLWRELSAPASERFDWELASSYLVEPPFVAGLTPDDPLPADLVDARVLAMFGDSLTTDHISPSGEIPAASAAGEYLQGLGIAPPRFNTYVGRRCNHEVMARGTFANVRIRNLLVPDVEGGMTRKFPEGTLLTVHAAAQAYRKQRTPLLVVGGRDYGTGSSRDWAAKGTALLGVRAVLAESYERIHRANLVSMGVVPLRFLAGEGARALGLTGAERYSLRGLRAAVLEGTPVDVVAEGAGAARHFTVAADVQTDAERRLLVDGGMLPSVMKHFSARSRQRTS